MMPEATSYIEISRSAIANNMAFIRNMIGEQVQLSLVVKGNAYGHGIETYCPLAYEAGARHFSTFDAREAWQVQQSLPAGHQAVIMIMGMIEHHDLPWAVEEGIEFFVFEWGRLEAALAAAKKTGRAAKIHVEVETGMHRTGFEQEELKRVFRFIKAHAVYLHLRGVCTHLAGAESIANYKRITDQQKRFKKIKAWVESLGFSPSPAFHMASSAATIRYPRTRLDMVRVGIMQYGFFPTEEIWVHYLSKQKSYENPLQRVISWKSRVMDIKDVKTGEFIGYGNSFFTNKPTRIAIVPVGYGYGYSRSLSNRGKVLIGQTRLNVVGTVNMNMIAVDVTPLDKVQKGQEVVLIGKQGTQEITVASLGDYSRLLNYELLVRLPHSIPRRVVD
ncbi:alanine racemase [Thermonema sp.]|uniref:alanine racemase n=1 Tax=Thermonema sp. TaxID=2231181 RepID=UPI0027E5710A|nr:alanine racemase [Thermonema sp.]